MLEAGIQRGRWGGADSCRQGGVGSAVGMVTWKLHVQGIDGRLAPQPKDPGPLPLGEWMHVRAHVCVNEGAHVSDVIFGSQPGI